MARNRHVRATGDFFSLATKGRLCRTTFSSPRVSPFRASRGTSEAAVAERIAPLSELRPFLLNPNRSSLIYSGVLEIFVTTP